MQRKAKKTKNKKTSAEGYKAIVPVIRRNKRENAVIGAVQLGRRRNFRQLCQAWMHFIVGGHMRSDPTFFTIAEAMMNMMLSCLDIIHVDFCFVPQKVACNCSLLFSG